MLVDLLKYTTNRLKCKVLFRQILKGVLFMKGKKGCICGNELIFVTATVSHFIFKKEIRVHNVPHFNCSNCGRSTYGKIENMIVKMLREAYLSDKTEIEYR